MTLHDLSSVSPVAHHRASFLDPFWDDGPRAQVERELLALFQRQLAVATRARAFVGRVPAELLRARGPLGRDEVEALPLLTKQELRAYLPDQLLVDPTDTFHMVRETGGTTGRPVGVFWGRSDWTAFIEALQRFAGPLGRLGKGFRAWNGYNQAHVSGPCFDDLIRAFGGTPVPRHFGASDREALAEIERMRAEVLVITPQSGSGKGGSLEDLLATEPGFLARLRIRALVVSSTLLRPDLLEEVREQGVTTVINYYGSTEAPPAAASCEASPTTFHLTQGHVLVEVVHPDGRQVRSGERGAVVVSRIGASDGVSVRPSSATQLLRFVVGDTALFIDEPCACGRTSPRIADIARVTDVEDKLRGGCERWE
ncbi:MAG: AMP-binding protein [Polyangiales bacterium]